MLDVTAIHSLTDFVRNARAHVDRIKSTETPEVLTINGKAEVVVQSATSYQRMVTELERAKDLAKLYEGLRDIDQGRVQPVDSAFRAIQDELGV